MSFYHKYVYYYIIILVYKTDYCIFNMKLNFRFIHESLLNLKNKNHMILHILQGIKKAM